MDSVKLSQKIRLHALRMTSRGGSSHIGSVFSMADILAVLYGCILKYDSKRPEWKERDRFILSKGHGGAGVYAVLAECGFFSISKLESHYQDGSDLSGHVSHKGIPGVDISTGSLGHGLPIGAGMALAAKLDNLKRRTFVVLSDGECDEGSNWEAALFASHHRLDNLTIVIDYNKIQSLTTVKETLNLEPFKEKWESFGWNVKEVDGHNHDQMKSAFEEIPFQKDRPNCVIAHTIKGKGVSFMENKVLWHYRTAKDEEYEAALKELEQA
jgi:transketolase